MADRERESAVEGQPSEGEATPPPSAVPGACPDCAETRLTLIRDSALVSVYKCPKCGHLSAPVKRP